MLNIWSLLNSDVFNGIANAGQVCDIVLNLKQVSNDKIMQELENQDNLYLVRCIDQNEKIIKQNEEIIEKLNIILKQNY